MIHLRSVQHLVPCFAACVTLWLVAIANPAASQTVPVRSGAHDGFDRLVLDMPTRTPWRIERRSDGASVIFDSAGIRFDLGAVFERIGRQRLRAISASADGRLDLEFACACEIEPFWHLGDLLVIDISDPPPDTRASPSRPASRPVVAPQSDRLAEDGFVVRGRSTATVALAERLDERIGPRLSARSEAAPAPAPPDEALGAVRATLRQQLDRAASQGLVTPAPDQRQHVTPDPPAPVPAPAPPPADADLSETQAGRAPVPGLRVTTGMDRDMVGPAPPDRTTLACPPVADIDVAAWGGTRPFAAEVGQINGMLFGEFDTVQQAAALRLARLYIHHGFGAEARQVLGWLDAGSPEVAIARELAALVDASRLPADARLGDALGCGEPGVIWAILALPELPEESVFDHRALKRAFAALPDGLRRALGPTLVRRLVAAGHHGTADAVLRQLRGGDALSDADTGMAQAALSDTVGKADAVEAALREITRTNTIQTGAALAKTIERALAREAPVAFDDAQFAGALAFEHRGTPLGERLALAYLSALAASGAFDEAITEFQRLRLSLNDPARSRVASVLTSYLVRRGDDLTFLRAMMTDRVAPPGALDAPVSLAVARRLLDLGFPAQAARHVAPAEAGETDADRKARRLLRARIVLAQDRPTDAWRELVGLKGEEADLLRATILVARGDHANAWQLFATHDAVRRADRAALHLGSVVALEQAEDPQLAKIGEIMMTDAVAPAADAGAGVAVPRALLERSTALRGAMQRLLATTPAPPDRK